MWMYCPGHAGVKEDDRGDRLAGKDSCGCTVLDVLGSRNHDGRADELAGKVAITNSLRFGRSEVLRILTHYLQVQKHGHHTIDRLE